MQIALIVQRFYIPLISSNRIAVIIAMEFYLVKDLVEMKNLEELHSQSQHRENGREIEPCLYFHLDFPALVRTANQSKSGREFAGKLREVVKRDYYEYSDADFRLTLNRLNRDKVLTLDAGITFNVFKEEGSDEMGFHLLFGEKNFQIWMTLSLCHLPTENSPVSREALFVLDDYLYPAYNSCGSDSYESASCDKEDIEEIRKLWNHKTGFVYAKLTVGVEVNKEAVKMVLEDTGEECHEIVGLNRKMLTEEICTDLEIRCRDGEIVKCHRAVLGGRSKVFQAMFQAEEMEEARTGKLEMEEMSEEGVRAFLGWVYWKDEKEALLESDVAMELLIAGDKFFGKTYPGKLLESEEYQELIKNDTQAAMELIKDN